MVNTIKRPPFALFPHPGLGGGDLKKGGQLRSRGVRKKRGGNYGQGGYAKKGGCLRSRRVRNKGCAVYSVGFPNGFLKVFLMVF